MKVSSLPFVLVFVSSLLPLAGALANVNVYHAPAGLALIGLAIASAFARRPSVAKRTRINWAMFLLAVVLLIQIFTGRGFVTLATGGYVVAFLFVFHNLFLTGNGISAERIVGGVDFIYKYLIVGLMIEYVAVTLGMQPALHRILSSPASPGYKVGNGADAAHALGLLGNNAGGLNSVLLGTQIAGMISLFAAIWFIGSRKIRPAGVQSGYSGLWIFLSSLMLVVTVNGTVFLLLILAIVIYGLFMNRTSRMPALVLIVAILAGTFALISEGYLFSRIFNENAVNLQVPMQDTRIADELKGISTVGYYIFEFYTPVAQFMALDWSDKLFGAGAEYLTTTSDYLSGDFGFGAALLSSGLVWMGAFVSIVFAISFPAIRNVEGKSDARNVWSVLASINGLTAILWLFSTLHYNQAFANPCGIMFFGLHLALTTYSGSRSRVRERGGIAPKLQ